MERELLHYAYENGMIDMDAIREQIEMNERIKYLEMHTNKIWQGADGKWYTYIPDNSRSDGRKKVKRTTEKALYDLIVQYYKKSEEVMRFKEVFDEWSQAKLGYGEIQKQTYDRYHSDYKRFFEGARIAEVKFDHITEDMLEDFVKSSIHDKNLTAKAWSGLRLIILGVFKYAKKKGYTKISITNFMGDLDLSKKAFQKRTFKDKDSVFTDAEIDLIVDYVRNKEPSIINFGIILAFQTGLRIGELAALKWTDVNGNILTVNKTEIRYRGDDGNYVYEIRESAKTEAGNREVILSNSAVATLKRIRLMNPFGEFIFSKNGVRIKEKAFSVKIVKICEYVGIPPRSMHKARKTYATKLLNAGVDERLVINQLGHTDISTTKHFYYFNNKDEDDAKQQIEKALNY